MCGIAGFSLSPNERPINANRLARHLLLGIESRGKDATGAAWRTDQGLGVVIQKKDMTASKWVNSLSVPRTASEVLLHTRAWTQGPPAVAANNHPITVGPITGVHNGMVWNDLEIFNDLGKYGVSRQAAVDSEAIFALLAHGAGVYPVEHDTDLLEMVQGSAAIAYFDTTGPNNELHLARICGSPLVIAQTDAGSLVFASTVEAIEQAMFHMHLTIDYMDEKVKEGTYFRIREGLIAEKQNFMPDYSYYSKRPSASVSSRIAAVTTVPSADDGYRWCQEHDEYDWFCDCSAKVESKALTRYEPIEPKPQGWMATGIVETANLFTVHDVTPASDNDFFNWYNARVEGIVNFTKLMEDTPGSKPETVLKALDRNHWQTRPGDWVRTDICLGQDGTTVEVHGQVLEIPDQFPGGDYLLRILIPAGEARNAEYVMARRKNFEFEDLKDYTDRLVPTDNTALVAN
jgi:hypothetical protein